MTVDLWLGDCLEIMPTLPDKSVDAIITDLPYGTTACKWDVIIPLDEMWKQVKRICKGAFVTTASQPFTSVLIGSNLKMFSHEVIWEKSRPSSGLAAETMPLKAHENILLFSRNGFTYNPQMWKGNKNHDTRASRKTSNIIGYSGISTPNTSDEKYPRTVVYFESAGKTEHPTQKPVALYEYLIRTYTNEGDTVLDFCMGSGTTGVACVKTNRNFIGIEKEQPYLEIAQKRISEAQMQMVMDFKC